MARVNLLTAVIFCSLVAACFAQLPDGFWDFNTEEFDEGSEVRLDCNFTYQDQEDDLIPAGSWYSPAEWMLPNLTRLDGDSAGEYSGYRLSDDLFYLTILSVDKDFTGTYHCMLLVNDTDWALIRKGVNLKGPYFISSKEVWEDTYRTPFIIGISACLGFLAAATLMYLVYLFNWVPEERSNQVEPGYSAYGTVDGKTNG